MFYWTNWADFNPCEVPTETRDEWAAEQVRDLVGKDYTLTRSGDSVVISTRTPDGQIEVLDCILRRIARV